MDTKPRIRRAGRLVAITVAASIALLPAAAPAGAHPAKNTKRAGMVNTHRQNNGLSTLKHNKTLRKKAHKHAKKLAETGSLAHSTTKQLINYMDAANCSLIAENVGYNSKSLWQLHQAFKASSSHNQNLLDSRWKKMGMGVHLDGNGWVWATQLFCK